MQTQSLPDGNEQLEVDWSKVALDTVQIVDKTREEAEEGLWLEVGPLFFVVVG